MFFIPHLFAKEAVYKKENDKAYNKMVKENNDLRSTLHYYLFIKATEADINALVSGEWNRGSRLRLTMCRSKSGEPLWATAKDMDDLIALMTEHREMFNLEPSPDGFQVDDRVMLKAARAVWDILALSPYHTEEGRMLQAKLKEVALGSETPEADAVKVAQGSLSQARSNLLHTVHPSAGTLVAYYDMLVCLHPDRNATDSADLYKEYLKILLDTYSKTQQFSTSWWQLKAVLERYYHARQ